MNRKRNKIEFDALGPDTKAHATDKKESESRADKLSYIGPSESGSIAPADGPVVAKSFRSETKASPDESHSAQKQTEELFRTIQSMGVDAQVKEVTSQYAMFRKRSIEQRLRSCLILHHADHQLEPKPKAAVMKQLNMDKSYFSRLAKIGKNYERLWAISSHLPYSFGSLWLIAGQTAAAIDKAVKEGIIRPDVTEAELVAAFPNKPKPNPSDALDAKNGKVTFADDDRSTMEEHAPRSNQLAGLGSSEGTATPNEAAQDDPNQTKEEKPGAPKPMVGLIRYAEFHIPAKGFSRGAKAAVKATLQKVAAGCGGDVKFYTE